MEKRRRFIINFLYLAIILGVAFLFIQFLLPLLAPFVIGLFIAYVLQRPTRFLAGKTRLPRKLMAVLLVLVFYGTVGVLLALAGIRAFSGITQLIGELPSLVRLYVQPVLTQLFQELEDTVTRMDPTLLETVNYLQDQLMQMLGELVSRVSMGSMELISSFASSLPMLFLKLLLMVISTFFIAMDFDRITAFCMRQLDDLGKEIFLQVKQYVVGTLFVCIRSYALIMSITFVELLIGFTNRSGAGADPGTLYRDLRYPSGPGNGRDHDPLGSDHGTAWGLYYGVEAVCAVCYHYDHPEYH